MWIMTPFGIIMPAATPKDVFDETGFDLQVRARDRATLQKLRNRYMAHWETGEIRRTRGMDYEFRFLCDRSDFAGAMATMVEEIDYEKFKPTTMRKGNGGSRLMHLYNHIWYVIAREYDSVIIGGKGPRK